MAALRGLLFVASGRLLPLAAAHECPEQVAVPSSCPSGAGSPVKRIGRDRFIRNVLIAAGNSNEPNLRLAVQALLNDPSTIVSEAAHWAMEELSA